MTRLRVETLAGGKQIIQFLKMSTRKRFCSQFSEQMQIPIFISSTNPWTAKQSKANHVSWETHSFPLDLNCDFYVFFAEFTSPLITAQGLIWRSKDANSATLVKPSEVFSCWEFSLFCKRSSNFPANSQCRVITLNSLQF